MADLNLQIAWFWFSLGIVSGIRLGVCFHRPAWLGGYDSWPRRMIRLGHIAFFGTGFLNLAFALSVPHLAPDRTIAVSPPLTEIAFELHSLLTACSLLLIVGAVSMPTVCFFCAWRKPLRHLFALPVVTLLGGVGLFTVLILTTPLQGG